MAAGAEHGAAPGLLSKAEVHVKELEEFEDYYFGTDRRVKMEAAAAKVLAYVDEALAPLRPAPHDLNVRGLFLKGRAVSFLPDKEAQAEEWLTKVIKLDPKHLGAWNALGEVHWNTQNYQRARECFEHALEFCGENTVSLRSLSMVLRAVDSEASARDDDVVASRRAANFAEALEKAKAAVALDASDPQNWETLGNAYVGDFFVNAKRPDELKRALIAYAKAETAYGKLGKSNPSLHLNRGIAAKYIEDYDLALHSFRKAQEIGDVNAAQQGQKVKELVQRLSGYTQRKGDLKAKHLKELLEGFKQGGETVRSLRDFQANAGSAELPLAAKVVNIVDRQEELPMIVICCDAFGDFFALSVYNAKPSILADAVVPMKSIIHIRQAKFREVRVQANHKTWNYPSVRVGHPGDITVVGGKSLEAAAVVSQFSAAALPREPQVEASAVVLAGGDATPSVQSEAEAQAEVDPKQLKWIEQEDAKMKKEEAKAKARAKAKVKGKAKKKEKGSDKVVARPGQLEAAGNVGSDAEIETNTGSESYMDNESKTEQETTDCSPMLDALPKPAAVRWSDLDDSDSGDEFQPLKPAPKYLVEVEA